MSNAAESIKTDDESVQMSDSAAIKIWELREEEGNSQLKLRVYIEGGGCSGFQYGFTFDELINEDDTVIDKTISTPNHSTAIVTLLIDAMSMQYLMGAEIDYKDDVEGERFIIRNPNAATTCGCGSSFSMKEDEDSGDKEG